MINQRVHAPIRVLFIDHTARMSGGEIALRNVVMKLNAARICPTVLLCAEGPLAEQLRPYCDVRVLPLSTRLAETRKDTLGLNSLLRLRDLLSLISYTWRMSRVIKTLNIDAVHTNTLKSHIIGGVAARLAGRSLVWHLRDRIAPDYLPYAAVRVVRILSRLLPNVIVANSHATLSTVHSEALPFAHAVDEPNKFIHSKRWKVIHDGCDVPPDTPQAMLSSPITIGLVGRISPWKGQHVFIKAAAIARAQMPNLRFQIIGAPLFAEEEYEAHVKRMSSELGLDGSVDFLGFVSDVQKAVAQLHIVVHASTIGEPFGQVVIEGMAAGKAVIATRGGGIPEIVLDHVTGLLVPMNDEHAMAGAMLALARDPEKMKEMGQRGRERVREQFTIEKSARAIEQLYDDLLGATRRQASVHRIPDVIQLPEAKVAIAAPQPGASGRNCGR